MLLYFPKNKTPTLTAVHLFGVFIQSAFELYGADFMLGEDLSPWLIEINSSPSMCRNTRATVKLVDMVMEDTIKGNGYYVSIVTIIQASHKI